MTRGITKAISKTDRRFLILKSFFTNTTLLSRDRRNELIRRHGTLEKDKLIRINTAF